MSSSPSADEEPDALRWADLPEPVERWSYTPSIRLTRELMGERMFPLTLEELDAAMLELRHAGVAAPRPRPSTGPSGP